MDKNSRLEKMLSALSNDDQDALEALFKYYYPRLHHFAKSFLKLDEGIDDILQEVFLKIWINRKKINNTQSFNAYIFTITRNLLLNELRNRLNDRKAKDALIEKSVAEEFILFRQIEFDELTEKVNQIVSHLPEKQKEIFTLSRTKGLSHKEISQELHIAEKTVEYHIHQVIEILKRQLKGMGLYIMLYICLVF